MGGNDVRLRTDAKNVKNLNFLEIFGKLWPLVFRKRMIRQITALVLFCLMTVVVATSQPGLRFCLCLEEFFVANCECADSCVIEEASMNHDAGCCTGSCDLVSHETSLGDFSKICALSDCSLNIHFESSDFVESSNQVRSDLKDEHSKELSFPSIDLFSEESLACFLRSSIHGTRGSPSLHGRSLSTYPLYKRFSVFLV